MKEGLSRTYDEYGNIVKECFYINGKLEGGYSLWYTDRIYQRQNLQKHIYCLFKNHKIIKYIEWNRNGTKKIEYNKHNKFIHNLEKQLQRENEEGYHLKSGQAGI